MRKISFCIVCMNRLHQLKETLLINIGHYLGNDVVEFILLNYNSQDGMDEWVRKTIAEHMQSGLLKYYKTTEPKVFSHSHAKNMVFNLASGEILCSINADHFIGEGFDKYLLDKFSAKSKIFVSPYVEENSKSRYIPPRDVVGKICVRKKDFLEVEGFDERFKNYGFEDIDFVKRLQHLGLQQITLNIPEFLEFIAHGDEERIQKAEHVFDAFVRYTSPTETVVLYLNKDHSYEKVTFLRIDSLDAHKPKHAFEQRNFIYSFEIKGNRWENGQWKVGKDEVCLLPNKFQAYGMILNIPHKDVLKDQHRNQIYYRIKSDYNLTALYTMRSFMKNLNLMRSNVRLKKIAVNKGNYGAGRVVKVSSAIQSEKNIL
jgi:hypothetical protein